MRISGIPTVLLPLMLLLSLVLGCRLTEPVPPVAEAGGPITVEAGATLRLDAAGSFDPDDAELVRYRWRIIGTPEDHGERRGEVLVDGSEPVVEVPAPFDEDDAGRWELELEVTDATGRRATDTVFLDVVP